MSQPEKPRSQFVLKLHELLTAEQHPDWLKWLSNDTFGITSIEAQAKAALAPQWEFRSLSSFIRQLSYYSFKRLSDRRRSAERRSHNPSMIVFTHTSGNFVRDDPSKTANIPRKLRARKSTAGSRRKSSTASSIAFDYEYQDRSPTPDAYFHPQFDEEPPSQTQISLASYQLPPWTVPTDVQTSPRPLPISPSASALSVRDASVPSYDCAPEDSPLSRSYTSPGTALSSFNFSTTPNQPYRDPLPPPPASSSYYYAPTTYVAPAYATTELPPIRTITSGLVGPAPPAPADVYSPYPSIAAPQPARRGSHVLEHPDEHESPSIAPVSAIANGLAGLDPVDERSYYPPSPPRQQVHTVPPVPHYAQLSNTPHDFYPSPTYSCAADVSEEHHKPFYHLAGRDVYTSYSMPAYH